MARSESWLYGSRCRLPQSASYPGRQPTESVVQTAKKTDGEVHSHHRVSRLRKRYKDATVPAEWLQYSPLVVSDEVQDQRNIVALELRPVIYLSDVTADGVVLLRVVDCGGVLMEDCAARGRSPFMAIDPVRHAHSLPDFGKGLPGHVPGPGSPLP